MKRTLLLAALLSLAVILPAGAHDYTAGPLKIAHPWTRATPKGAAVAAGYLKITNTGSQPDRLIGGSTPIADRFEIHEMAMDAGVMRMRQLPNGIEIKPGQTVEFKPGSFHLMFTGLHRPVLKDGNRVKGTLAFEKAGKVEVEYAVEAIGSAPGDHQH